MHIFRGTFGNHEDIDTLYHIEPLGKTSNGVRMRKQCSYFTLCSLFCIHACVHYAQIEQTHIMYNSSELSVERRNGTCGKMGMTARCSDGQ